MMLAKSGQLTTFLLVIAPVPTFLFCGLPQSEKERRMQSFSFVFLLLSVIGNTLWSAYAQKINNMDMEIPAVFGWFVSTILLMMYITVQFDPRQMM